MIKETNFKIHTDTEPNGESGRDGRSQLSPLPLSSEIRFLSLPSWVKKATIELTLVQKECVWPPSREEGWSQPFLQGIETMEHLQCHKKEWENNANANAFDHLAI